MQETINHYEALESKGVDTLKLVEKAYLDFFEKYSPNTKSTFERMLFDMLLPFRKIKGSIFLKMLIDYSLNIMPKFYLYFPSIFKNRLGEMSPKVYQNISDSFCKKWEKELYPAKIFFYPNISLKQAEEVVFKYLAALSCIICNRVEIFEQAREYYQQGFELHVSAKAEAKTIAEVKPYLEIGKKVRDGGKKGSEIVYGKEEERQKKYTAYQNKLNELREQYPHQKIPSLRKQVAKHFAVSPKTIKRHTR